MTKRYKTGGRQKGTPNRISKDLRDRITDFLSDKWQLIEQDFENIEPKERLMFYEKLLSYSLPKLSATELNVDAKTPEPIIIDWSLFSDNELRTLSKIQDKVITPKVLENENQKET